MHAKHMHTYYLNTQTLYILIHHNKHHPIHAIVKTEKEKKRTHAEASMARVRPPRSSPEVATDLANNVGEEGD